MSPVDQQVLGEAADRLRDALGALARAKEVINTREVATAYTRAEEALLWVNSERWPRACGPECECNR